MKKLLLVLLTLVLVVGISSRLPVLAQTDAPPPAGVLRVDAGIDLGPISPFIFGANHGAYGEVPPAQFETAAQSGVTYFRFPGGASFDEDGRDLQTFQIDLLIALCRITGAEPAIQVRLYQGTPEKAVEILEYTNLKKQYGVRYWSIGNEPNLYPDYTVEELNAEWRAIAEAMLAADPTITLIGPDLSQYTGTEAANPRDPNGKDYMLEFLQANGDLVDIVSVHRYPFPRNNQSATIDDLRTNTREWDQIVSLLRDQVITLTGEDKPLAITEINSHWSNILGGEATSDSHFHAIWIGDVLGRLIRNRVSIGAYFEFFSGPDRAFGLIERYGVRPTYYTYQLYSRFGTDEVAAASGEEWVSVYAARSADGSLTVMVVNLADEEATVTLELANFTPSGAAAVWRLAAEQQPDEPETQDISSGSPLTLPGQSITLYVIPGA